MFDLVELCQLQSELHSLCFLMMSFLSSKRVAIHQIFSLICYSSALVDIVIFVANIQMGHGLKPKLISICKLLCDTTSFLTSHFIDYYHPNNFVL